MIHERNLGEINTEERKNFIATKANEKPKEVHLYGNGWFHGLLKKESFYL